MDLKEETMKRVKLEKLSDIVPINVEADEFTGYTVTKNTDVNGDHYELLDREEKYLFLFKMLDVNIYISEYHLLDRLLNKYIVPIENKEIYEHGYPEGRLVPSNFYEKCEEEYLENVKEEISEKVENIIQEYF